MIILSTRINKTVIYLHPYMGLQLLTSLLQREQLASRTGQWGHRHSLWLSFNMALEA